MKLVLYKPVSPLVVNQNFGEDNACIDLATHTKTIGRGGLTCPMGYESLYKWAGYNGHNALDLEATRWQPIYAAQEGFVEELVSEERRGLGLGVVSENQYDFTAGPFNTAGQWNAKTRYWHLAAFNVRLGDKIKAGQLIGWADNTGFSSGDHLHFELKPVFRNENGQWWNVFQTNGYQGAIDPTPYLSQLSAFEINSFLVRIRYQIANLINQSKISG